MVAVEDIFFPMEMYHNKYTEVNKLLFESKNSEIYLVKNLENKLFICKKISKNKFDSREYMLPNNIDDDEKIVKIIEMYKDCRWCRLVMEYRPNSIDLFEYFNEANVINIPEKTLRTTIKEMALAVKCCHEAGVAHLDIKFENFIVIERDPLKLMMIDFGSSYKINEKLPKIVGTQNYYAPELTDLRFSLKSDIWSLGVCIYYNFTSDNYFKSNKHDQNCSNVRNKISEMTNCSDSMKDLLHNMIVHNPDERYTIDQVLSHRWFSEKLK